MSRRRVAITGLGLVTPVGNDVASTWAALLAGRSGAAQITSFDASGFPVRIAAEVKGLDDAAVLQALGGERKLLKFANRSHRFALVAAATSLCRCRYPPDRGHGHALGLRGRHRHDGRDLRRTGPGSSATPPPTASWMPSRLLDAQGSAADPLAFCRSNSAGGAALLTRVFGIQGYSSSVHTACASGGQAVGTALKLIRRGEADCVLAGGFDSMINPVGLAGFCLLNAVSPDNDAPERASRPFDATRNGFVLGEGAGFLVLEEWHAARARGARIYAELAGDGNSLSSYRITDSHPSGDGPIQAMRQAMADAGARLADVNYLNAHGTSTPMNDRSECAAVKAVWGEARDQVAVSSTKSVTGHLIAAAGAVEAAICALSIHHGMLPVNANLREPDPDCDLDIVRDAPRARRVRIALSNSLGFGGSNSCLAFRHPDDVEALL